MPSNKELLNKYLKKENLFVLILIGILLMVISWPVEEEEKETLSGYSPEVQTVVGEYSETGGAIDSYSEEIKKQLEQILSSMEGVGKCNVMITFSSTYESIVLKDYDVTGNTREEISGERSVSENDATRVETTVYYTDEAGNEVPYLTKTIYPEVEGVVVVAEGGNNPDTIIHITEVIQALFGIEAHKIRVVEMNSE